MGRSNKKNNNKEEKNLITIANKTINQWLNKLETKNKEIYKETLKSNYEEKSSNIIDPIIKNTKKKDKKKITLKKNEGKKNEYVTKNKKLARFIDIFIQDSMEKNNFHFFITINFEKEIKKKEKIIEKTEILENLIENKFKLWDYYYISPELNENKNYHLHIFLTIRSLIGYNESILKNIEKILVEEYEYDTKIEMPTTFLNIKKLFIYTTKEYEINKDIKKFAITEKTKKITKNIEKYFENIKVKEDEFKNIVGTNLLKKKHDRSLLINLWKSYIIANNYYIYKKWLCKKNERKLISYEKRKKIEILVENFNEIYKNLSEKFQIHLNGFDIEDFKNENLINQERTIYELNNITENTINPKFTLIELKDGIYNLINNKFLRKDRIKEKTIKDLSSTSTFKFYNKYYKNLTEPKKWIELIKNAIKNKEINEVKVNIIFEEICIRIANAFHNSDELVGKRKVLYIYGPTNSGKTSLVVNLIKNYFGEENISMMSESERFPFGDTDDKEVIIYDEFTYFEKLKNTFKRQFSQETNYIDIKHEKPKKMKEIPTFLAANEGPNEQWGHGNKNEHALALNQRVFAVKFNTLEEEILKEIIKEKTIKQIIKEEEVNIIVYCNKIYFKRLEELKNERIKKLTYKEQIRLITN